MPKVTFSPTITTGDDTTSDRQLASQSRAAVQCKSQFEYECPKDGTDPKLSAMNAFRIGRDRISEFIIQSPFAEANPIDAGKMICEAFNQGRKPFDYIHQGTYFGTRYQPTQFLLSIVNKKPTLAIPSTDKKYRRFVYPSPGKDIRLSAWETSENYLNLYGHIIINVPPNCYALATTGLERKPQIYAPGIHVIHDPYFRLLDLSQNEVQVGSSQTSPFASINSAFISIGNLHIVRVDVTELQPIIFAGSYVMLKPNRNAEPYYFYGSNITLMKPVKTDTPYIQHGDMHIVNVVAGKIALVSIDGEPELLHARKEAYEFRTSRFVYSKTVSATDDVIVWQSISRIIPQNGRVAIAYRKGNLEVSHPGQVLEVRDPNYLFAQMLDTNYQIRTFPSDEVVRERKKAGVPAEEQNVEVVTTSDGLRLGTRLAIRFKVDNPELMLSLVDLNEYLQHIENLAVTDLARAISTMSSQDCLSLNNEGAAPPRYLGEESASNTDAVGPSTKLHENPDEPTAVIKETALMIQDQLNQQLAEFGIILKRLTMDSPKPMNAAIAMEREKSSTELIKVRVQMGLINGQNEIAQADAKREVMKKQITQRGEYELRLAQAEQEKALAEMNNQIKISQANTERAILAQQGELYQQYPYLAREKFAKITAEGMRGSHVQLSDRPWSSFAETLFSHLPESEQQKRR